MKTVWLTMLQTHCSTFKNKISIPRGTYFEIPSTTKRQNLLNPEDIVEQLLNSTRK
jgi:hypothetical protein